MTLITYPASPCTDDTGAIVTPTSVGVAITDADGNAVANAVATGHFAGPNLSAKYDAVLYGEAWLTLSPVLAGHTFANYAKSGLYASADSSSIAAAALNTPAADAAALLSAAFITIPADHTTSGVAEVLTYKQMLAVPLAVPASDNVSTLAAPSSTATTSYYLAGQPAVSANLVYIGTVTYGATGQETGRTVKLASPFPSF